MTPRIDSHHHAWLLARGDHDWLTPASGSLYRDYTVADLAPLVAATGIAATVLVQAAESVADTHYLLSVAEATPWVAGVIGWADLMAVDAPAQIAGLAADPMLKGLRPMLQDLPDDDFILQPQIAPALAAMQDLGLCLDLLIRPRHLSRVFELRRRFPDLPMMIDHAAKPVFERDALRDWADGLRAVAADGVTCCKLSGLVTEAGCDWTVDRLRPCVDVILDVFGPDRVAWGSDWPVLTLAASYGDWVAATETLLDGVGDTARAAILGGTAIDFYKLEI